MVEAEREWNKSSLLCSNRLDSIVQADYEAMIVVLGRAILLHTAFHYRASNTQGNRIRR